MLVSWNWLKDYVDLDMTADQLTHRLAMAGLNLESIQSVEDDLAIDLEVTSNRPDCLGHIGIAREAAALWDRPLKLPEIRLVECEPAASALTQVAIACPDLCRRYTARVVRNVQVGPSPPWLVQRLRALGIAVINNIVDITNYVLMECGQPLHAFDYDKLAERRIVVRRARPGERFMAIDHRVYDLTDQMCVIADARQAVAIGGVMGGAETEVSERTRNILVESAQFTPLSIRSTSRTLRLHSPSSYRFERGVDPEGVDWASRRAAQLIVQLAGGELAAGSVDVWPGRPAPRPPFVLRLSQIRRVLGIDIDADEVVSILRRLGLAVQRAENGRVTAQPPSWRLDLEREIDLVEEVARIHGYDAIPEDVSVAMVPSSRPRFDRVVETVREVLVAAGFDEAVTVSAVEASLSDSFSPWTDAPAISTETPMLKGADRLRRSLIPSLLACRQMNESLGNHRIELFETAKVYLARPRGLPEEPWMLALTSGRDFFAVKGVLEQILARLHIRAHLSAAPVDQNLLDRHQSCQLRLGDELWGYLGAVSAAGMKTFALRRPAVVAEIRLDLLVQLASLIPAYQPISPFPAIEYDVNLVVPESVLWSGLASTIHQSGGEHLEQLEYRETYRDPERDGPGYKRLLFSLRLRSRAGTLTGEEGEAIRSRIVAACQHDHSARLLG